MDTQSFYRTVRERLGQCDREETKRGTAAVFHALRDRLTPDEADQVAAQLPRPLEDIVRLAPDGEPGAFPPFGRLFGARPSPPRRS